MRINVYTSQVYRFTGEICARKHQINLLQSITNKSNSIQVFITCITNKKSFHTVLFPQGGDGRVALTTSESGNLGVIKYLLDDDDDNVVLLKLKAEKSIWLKLWDAECQIFEIDNRKDLLMPFCFCFNASRTKEGKKRQFPFSSLNSWNKIAGNDLETLISEEMEANVNLGMLEYYQNNPLIAAKLALDWMAMKNIQHEDIELRHLALLPVYNFGTAQYDFKPVFIDLSRVTETSLEQSQEAANRSYQFLKDEFAKLE